MKKTLSPKLGALLFIFLTFMACSSEDGANGLDGMDGIDGIDGTDGTDGTDGLTSLISTTVEEPGTNCANGGFRLDIGLDSNENGQLDAGEVSSSQYLCNLDPADGLTSLIGTVIEQPGANCANGGYRLDVGLDSNGNGELDESEVTSSEYLCNADAADFNYQSYASLISQTGTDDPVSSVLDNSLGLNIVWARESQGRYLGTLDRSIDIGKTVIFFSTPSSHTGVRGELVSDNQIRLELQNGINVFADNFENLSFELREYE
ncbi:DUF7151 family protein [Flagellimonas hadalis]|uniref:DUF7151 domain-containing protein n=1 Tax=Flagellimonas hadalis TaxID=2597517 RepID=A0A5N5ITV0_9FLAO|nr:hypothetical protein [Allomuricauda hadalis]KAB5492001.1 hypothetical protein FOT42_003360 [Allomuricauda hadalis]